MVLIDGMSAWVKNLIFLVLFAAFLDLLLPNQSMRSFLRVVVGLFIMTAVLQPLASFIEDGAQAGGAPAVAPMQTKVDARFAAADENLARLKYAAYKRELERQIQAAAMAEPTVARAKAHVTLGARVEADPRGGIERVELWIAPDGAREKPEKIEVRLGQKPENTELFSQLSNKILHRVSDLYQIPAEKITVKRMAMGEMQNE